LLLEGDFSFLQNEYYYITTSWGCSQNCSYCGTRFAVGSFHSKPLETCVKELQTGLKKGFTKFVIEGDDIGGYGKDIGKTLVDLLDELTKIKAKYSITITAINPVWLIKNSKKLMKIFSRGKITCLNIPFQSGNQRILRLMNRYAQVEQMIQLIKDIKHACPDMKIGTHCIIGFPSETLDEFQDTLEFIIKANFDMGLVNLMSVKDGTEAEHLTPKIPFEEIMRRKQLTQRFLKKNGYKVFSTEKKVIFG